MFTHEGYLKQKQEDEAAAQGKAQTQTEGLMVKSGGSSGSFTASSPSLPSSNLDERVRPLQMLGRGLDTPPRHKCRCPHFWGDRLTFEPVDCPPEYG